MRQRDHHLPGIALKFIYRVDVIAKYESILCTSSVYVGISLVRLQRRANWSAQLPSTGRISLTVEIDSRWKMF